MTRTRSDRAPGLVNGATLPYYVGGFLGPFGTLVVTPIYPELEKSFSASSEAVNWGFSGYFLPMAVMMLVSGTIGERYGRARVMRITYIGYAIATVLAILAPSLGWFIAARVLQGLGNAFFTPLMLAGLADITEPKRLGRVMGMYSSFQAAGGALSPIAGGLAARYDWRYAFVVIAAMSFLLSFRPPPGEPRPDAQAPPIKPLLTWRMVLLWITGFAAATGPVGIGVVVGVASRKGLDASSTESGLLLLAGGCGAAIVGPRWGSLLDRLGIRTYSLIGTAVASLIVATLGFADTLPLLAVGWFLGASLVPAVVVALTHLAASAVPTNRGGALSSVLAFRFLGHAVGPIILVPIYLDHHRLAFILAGALGLISLIGFALVSTSPEADTAPSSDVSPASR
ncbi:MAG: MFS transporter [Acidimicrobiales bacterium]